MPPFSLQPGARTSQPIARTRPIMNSVGSEWKAFEAEVTKYVENFSKHIEQQQATFRVQAAAQLNAWREAADKLAGEAKELAAEHRMLMRLRRKKSYRS
jgi:hypothetical protein